MVHQTGFLVFQLFIGMGGAQTGPNSLLELVYSYFLKLNIGLGVTLKKFVQGGITLIVMLIVR